MKQSMVSDVFGKSATSVIDYLTEQSDNSINPRRNSFQAPPFPKEEV
jgi:hypothetical protein